MNFKKIAVIALMDILLLSELTASLYLAHLHPEAFTELFLKSFLPAAAATLLAGRFVLRRYFPQVAVETMAMEKGGERLK